MMSDELHKIAAFRRKGIRKQLESETGRNIASEHNYPARKPRSNKEITK